LESIFWKGKGKKSSGRGFVGSEQKICEAKDRPGEGSGFWADGESSQVFGIDLSSNVGAKNIDIANEFGDCVNGKESARTGNFC
jgi:hypothetical protein